MPRFEPVDHDPFAPRPMALMPVDNDPFMVSPEDAFAYGKGISPDATWRNLIPAAEFGLGMAPGSGEAMSARDAWDASGRGAEALSEGNYGDAASEYLNMGTGLLGAIPGAGIVARGTKRGAAWMDQNLPEGFNRLLDAVYPSDPGSTTNIFAGPTAKTADHAALAQAQEMKAQGASRADIWRETGWDLENPDKIPRFEIDDSGSGITPRVKERLARTDEGLAAYQGNISGGFEHPELYQAYEETQPFWNDYDLRKGPGGGRYYEDNEEIVAYGRRPEQAKSMTLHELQHAVQAREGFTPGSSPDRFRSKQDILEALSRANKNPEGYDPVTGDFAFILEENLKRAVEPHEAYRRTAGEVEARNVQSRMNMTAAERRAKGPWETQDVPDDQQIVRFGNNGPQASTTFGGPKAGGVRLERVIDDELPEGQAFFNILEEGRPSQGHVSGGLDPNDPTKFIIYSITAPSSSNSLGPSATRDLLRQLNEHFPDVTHVGGTRLTGARQRASVDVPSSQMSIPIRK